MSRKNNGAQATVVDAAPRTYTTAQRLGAEFLGTLWLVLGGCGTAVLAGKEVGFGGVAAAFGLTVLTGAYVFGPISGGHFNPAVSIGLASARRFDWKDVPAYAAAQVVGATVGALLLLGIAHGTGSFDPVKTGFASNGFGDRSPGGYGLGAVIITEVVMTAFFLLVILGATAKRATAAVTGLTIGLALTLIHLISIPVSNTSVNPARSLATAFFAGGDALGQVWVFIVAPIVGAVLGAVIHRRLLGDD